MESARFWITNKVAPAPYPGELTTDGGGKKPKEVKNEDVGGTNQKELKKEDGGGTNQKEVKKEDGAEEDSEDQKPVEDKTKENMTAKKSMTQMQKMNSAKMKNGCQRCCGNIMAFFAHDAIYGSFVGPHPVSFLFCCSLFKTKCPCCKRCSRPVCVASVATKLMNFIMLGVVTVLAGFFIIPWPNTILSFSSTSVASFYPCDGKMIKYKEANGGCENHAGYFMAYRCFFAYGTFLLTNSLLMIRVSNTRDDPYRSRLHHGFWLYKYLFLVALLFTYFLMLNGEQDKEGLFEFTASIIGNVAHLLFSIIEITFVMDLVELWVYENRTGKGKWANFIYGTVTFLVFLAALTIYVKIWIDFSFERDYKRGREPWPAWPNDNCIEGIKNRPDWSHMALIFSSSSVIIILITVQSFAKIFGITARFRYTGCLQAGVMILFNLVYLWSALTNSSNIHSRPHCNLAYLTFDRYREYNKTLLQKGSYDQYIGHAGFFHGVVCLLSLFYFAFVHGPRSKTAPLSLFYTYIFRIVDRIPSYPDEKDAEMDVPMGYLLAIEQSKVWDDEEICVAQSWSHFYFIMLLGSLSLMMSMTNFTNPWAADHYNSSNVAYYCKFGTAVIATGIYIILLISRFSSMHKYGLQAQKIRNRSASVGEIFEFHFGPVDEDEGELENGESQNNKNTFHFPHTNVDNVEVGKD